MQELPLGVIWEEDSTGSNMEELELVIYQSIVLDKMAKPTNHVLDVGYGWGMTSNYLYEKGCKSLTIIEERSDIAERANKWAADKPNVTVYQGDWKQVIPELKSWGKKFDGIYMDTFCPENEDFTFNKTEEEYGEMLSYFYVKPSQAEKDKYASFEMYAKDVANQNCILCLYEYSNYRNLEDLNFYYADTPWMVSGFPSTHKICWTYYVAGEFRKDRWFKKTDKFISDELCDKIINENKSSLVYKEETATINDIPHSRNFYYTPLKYNKELENILNSTIFKRFKPINMNDLYIGLFKYEQGEGYDRHVESLKGMPLDDKDQYVDTIDIALNSNGKTQVYDDWRVNSRWEFATVNCNKGQMLKYKTYQHVQYNKLEDGVRYQLLIFLKNSDYNKFLI